MELETLYQDTEEIGVMTRKEDGHESTRRIWVTYQEQLYGPDATKDSVGIELFEKQPTSVESARELGGKIAEALASK